LRKALHSLAFGMYFGSLDIGWCSSITLAGNEKKTDVVRGTGLVPGNMSGAT
jgi:hypothetical protein